MRLLLDESLPESLVAAGTAEISFGRWRGGGSDGDFIQAATEGGYDGVVFLGQSVLARANVVTAAREAGLLIVATSTEDPSDAQRDISRHAHSVPKNASAGLLLVQSHGVIATAAAEA